MRTIYNFLFLPLIIIVLASCEKVIDYELNNSTSMYVIEGAITNQPDQCQVRITRTVNFNDNNDFPAISGALVIITDNTGIRDTLVETSPGIYTSTLIGVPGKTYNLYAYFGNESFYATSSMPVPVPFDSIEFSEISMFGGPQNVPVPVYQDPLINKNYYRFVELVNGSRLDAVFVRDDLQTSGRLVKQPLINFSEDAPESGDTVSISMMCIEAAVYQYFFSLSQISGGGQNETGTPANPVSNIDGNALGYFSAHTVQLKTAIVP